MLQVQDGGDVVIAYYNKALSTGKRNYYTARKELLAMTNAVKPFQPHLYGRMSLLRTDHALLIWLCERA